MSASFVVSERADSFVEYPEPDGDAPARDPAWTWCPDLFAHAVSSALTVSWRLALVIAVAASLSYRPLRAAVEHPSAQHLWVIPVWAALVVLGERRRGARERPIHDRQTDGIIAAGLLGLSGLVYWTVVPRLGIDAPRFWLEVPLVVLFVMGWSVALFGTRPVLRHGRALLFVLVFGWPLTYRILIEVASGFGTADFMALIGIAAVASAVTVGRPLWHALLAAALTVALGALGTLLPFTASLTRDLAISATAPILACLPWLAGSLRGSIRSARTRRLIVPRARLAEGLAILMGVVLWTGVGAMADPPTSRLASPRMLAAIESAPPGWELLASIDVPSADIVFGGDAVWSRTYWSAAESNSSARGRDGAPRRIIIDDVRVKDSSQLTLMPFPADYELATWARSPVVTLETVEPFRLAVMAAALERPTDVSLGAVLVSVDLAVADESGQRLTVIAVDDHRVTAPFPEPGRGFRADTWATVQRLLRGDEASALRPERVDDARLLEAVLADLLLLSGRPDE